MQEHATGPRLAHHARVDLQPVRLAFDRHLQHASMRLADQVAVTCGITTDAFEIQIAATNLADCPGPRTNAPGQAAFRHRRRRHRHRFGLPYRRLGIEPVNQVVIAV
ncbi:hypothetical protein D3C76_1408090 [compost metagenome]